MSLVDFEAVAFFYLGVALVFAGATFGIVSRERDSSPTWLRIFFGIALGLGWPALLVFMLVRRLRA